MQNVVQKAREKFKEAVKRIQIGYWAPSLLAAIWWLTAAVLVLWTVAYLMERSFNDAPHAVLYLISIVFLLTVLFYSEGSDVAVSRLCDKDPDQLPEYLRPAFRALQESNPEVFISGRQLLAVFAVVALTLLCSRLSNVSNLYCGSLTPMAHEMGGLRDAYAFVFPIFFALWFAQLPPKFIAHERPLTAFGWACSRATISVSIFLGRALRVDGPSGKFKNLLLRWQKGTSERLRPSRENYYKDTAVLRDGKALEKVDIAVEVLDDGAVHVIEHFWFKAYAKGFHYIKHDVGWESKIKPGSELCVKQCPVGWTVPPSEELPVDIEKGKTYYPMRWEVKLKVDLPVDEYLEYIVEYFTEPSATKATAEGRDTYIYTVNEVPTAEISVTVLPKSDARFTFTDHHVVVKCSDDERVNALEADRVQLCEKDDGYRFTVLYPLLSTRFEFGWNVSGRIPKPYTAP